MPPSIKSSARKGDSPTEHWKPRWSVRCGSINFKTFQIMQQHIYYTKYALQFADIQIPELVTVFNHQVGNTGWTGMRAYHDHALIDEFLRRGIDVSAIYDGNSITFDRAVSYYIADNRLDTIC